MEIRTTDNTTHIEILKFKHANKDLEKRELSYTVGMQTKNSLTILKMFKCTPIMWSRHLASSIYLREIKAHKTCTRMFIADVSGIAKIWKHPKCPSTGNRYTNSSLPI